jgi:hypothetical protein
MIGDELMPVTDDEASLTKIEGRVKGRDNVEAAEAELGGEGIEELSGVAAVALLRREAEEFARWGWRDLRPALSPLSRARGVDSVCERILPCNTDAVLGEGMAASVLWVGLIATVRFWVPWGREESSSRSRRAVAVFETL